VSDNTHLSPKAGAGIIDLRRDPPQNHKHQVFHARPLIDLDPGNHRFHQRMVYAIDPLGIGVGVCPPGIAPDAYSRQRPSSKCRYCLANRSPQTHNFRIAKYF